MQRRCAEFMWCCVRSDERLPSTSVNSRRRLVSALATSMQDPGPETRAMRLGVWCASDDMVVSCLSLLLVLRLCMGQGGADGNAGVAVAESRLLARALVILRQMLDTRDGKRLFLLYRGVAILSMLLRSRNRTALL